jgi:signal transduction histidine kinase
MEHPLPAHILQQPESLDQVGDYLEFGVITLDAELIVRGWNHWMQTASGLSAAEATGHSLLELFPELLGSPSEAALRAAVEGQSVVLAQRFHRWLLPLPAPPGFEGFDHMQQSVRIAPVEQDDGTRSVIVIIQDVTERVAGEQELRRARDLAENASRAKSEFLASMSHELRTPLTAIIGFGDLLDSEVGGTLSALHKQHVQRIKSGAWHLVGIIDEILTFSRLEAGRLDLLSEQIDITALARETAAFLEPAAKSKGLELRVQTPLVPVFLATDVMRLRQVLINLLGNAIKFTDKGWIELALEQHADRVVFYVRDSGPGIAREHRERVFEPFRQVEQSTRRTKGGTGLGLSVSRKLARLMGGDLEIGDAGSQGSEFVFWLSRDGLA